MAYCPNPECNRKLKLSDWRELCPDCGVNVLYFGMEERMEEESDRVELAAAAAQKKFDRARAAVIGGPLAIARLVVVIAGVLGVAGAVAAIVTKFLSVTVSLTIGVPILTAALIALLVIQLVIKKRGGVPVKYKPCFIAGLPEEEVLAYIAEGGTVRQLREQKAAREALELIATDTLPA